MKRKDIEPLILDERDKQDAEWGGPDHDKHHSHIEWLFMIQAQVTRCMVEMPNLEVSMDQNTFKERMIKIAAICYATLESLEDE